MQYLKHTSALIIGVSFWSASPAVNAQSGAFVDPAAIDKAVLEFTGKPIGAAGGARTPVDRRLRLASCFSPLRLVLFGRRQDSIQVSCPDAGGWRIFVALTRAAAAPAAKALIAKGDRVTIAVEGRGFSVVQSGKALEAGGVGDWIKIAPPGKSETIRARVERPGRVVIPIE